MSALFPWWTEFFTVQLKKQDLLRAVDLLNQAIARDPTFLLAYCWLARAHDLIYFVLPPDHNPDHTPGRLALAKSAIDAAFRLQPDSGETHLALAWHLYWGYFDYDHARAEVEIAARSLPNNPRVFELRGLMDRRQGRWSEAVRNLERSSQLELMKHFSSRKRSRNHLRDAAGLR